MSSDEEISAYIQDYIGYMIDGDYEDIEQALYDSLSPDERLECGIYESTDLQYCLDQIDYNDEVYGFRDK